MKYSQYFEVAKRADTNREFIRLKDDKPKELVDLIAKIHQRLFYGALPNDWIYSVILEAFEALEENDLDDCTIEADIYNHDLLNWLYENGNTFAIQYCNDYLEEFGNRSNDIVQYISGGQWLSKDRIYTYVNDFILETSEE